MAGRRICAGYYRRYDGKVVYVISTATDNDTREETVIWTTFATMALQNGVDIKTVSSMLGHYDAGFTLRTYTHATRQKQDEAAATMGAFMEQML